MAVPNVLANRDELRDQWLERLEGLVRLVETWSQELGWSTRRIEKRLDDSQIGRYTAPALLLQEGVCRVLLEPIARSAPGADGVVDLYLLPAYDDIASLYFANAEWQVHYLAPDTPDVATMRDAPSQPISKEVLRQMLEAMKRNAA